MLISYFLFEFDTFIQVEESEQFLQFTSLAKMYEFLKRQSCPFHILPQKLEFNITLCDSYRLKIQCLSAIPYLK